MLLRAYGAQLILTRGRKAWAGCIKRAEDMVASDPRYFMPQQSRTGESEITARRRPRRSGATPTARRTSSSRASARRHHHRRGRSHPCAQALVPLHRRGARRLAGAVRRRQGTASDPGHRRGFVPEVLNTKIYDEIIRVKNDDAFTTARRRAARERACSWDFVRRGHLGRRRGRGPGGERRQLIVVIVPSFGERYLSTPLFADLAD